MSRQTDFAQRVYSAGLDAGLPDHLARLAAAQASLETGYGKSVKGNNFFGIKAGQSWTGKRQNLTTHEEYNGKRVKIKDSFRAYDDPADSLRDWAHLLQNKFPDAYNSSNFDEAVAGLQTGVYGAYATDSKYGSKLHSINNKYVGNGGTRYASTPIKGLPPQRPQTALAAIEALSPSNKTHFTKLGYAPEPPVKPAHLTATKPKKKRASTFDKISALNNAKKFERGEQNKFSDAGYGVQKVASAVGNSILDTGRNVLGGAQKVLEAQKPVQLPRPRPVTKTLTPPPRPKGLGTRPIKYIRAHDLAKYGVALPTNHTKPAPKLGGQSQAQIPLKLPNASQAQIPLTVPPKPLSTRNFDRAEAGFDVPYTKPMGKATINPTPAVQTIAPVGQQDFLQPPVKPQGLGSTMTPLQQVQTGVRQVLAPIRNLRHDAIGQVQGMTQGLGRGALSTIQQALGNRPSHTISLDRAASNGNIIHSNGYIYAGSPGNFKQVGKVKNGQAKMHSSSNEKPKGYRYYDSVKKQWMTK